MGLALVAASCTTRPTYVEGTGGAGATSSSTSSSGGMCLRAGDCPGTDSDCSRRVCSAGACSVLLAPKGAVVGRESAGDCQRNQCDGKGNVESVADDSDLPNDGNPCTQDVCKMGVPSHVDAPAMAPCGGNGATCNGSGVCKGCIASADCGVDTPCIHYKCNVDTCAITWTPSGMGDPGQQESGDCHKLVCNGIGGVARLADDADPPDDGNVCTSDKCGGGVSSHASSAKGEPCGGGNTCDGQGNCSGCSNDADCGASNACATFTCTQGKCSAKYTAAGKGAPPGDVLGDCKRPVCDGTGGTVAAPDDLDVPKTANPCVLALCKDGTLTTSAAAMSVTCGAGLCDGAGSCVGCAQNNQCPAEDGCSSFQCEGGVCVAAFKPFGTGAPAGDASGNCQSTACDGEGHALSIPDAADVPMSPSACASASCVGGLPTTTPLASGTPCSESGGTRCDGGGRCVP